MTKQNKQKSVSIPDEFQHSLFFEESLTLQYMTLPVQIKSLKTHLFIYDILFFKRIPLLDMPWNDHDLFLQHIFNDWEKESKEIAALFRKRDRQNAKKPMVEWIGLFIEALFWCNSSAVPSLRYMGQTVKELEISPVNAVERIELLFQHPDHYHAYIQLNEMFLELRKKYQKAVLLKK